MSWVAADALALAQLQATLTRLGAAPGPACVRLYASALPAAGDPVSDPGGHLAELPLASPPGTITAGVLKLAMASGASPMVLASGIPRWGLLVAGDGVPLARGSVSDDVHTGDIRVAGGTTPSGDDSPQLYAGGLVALTETFLT